MTGLQDHARALLREFKGDRYVFGLGCLDRLGGLARPLGAKAAVVANALDDGWRRPMGEQALASLAAAGVSLAGPVILGAGPNAPRQDVFRIRESIAAQRPDLIVVLGGGSTIDAAKAAAAMAALGESHPDIEEYFGVGQVSRMLAADNRAMGILPMSGTSDVRAISNTGKMPVPRVARLIPLVAVQLAASSAAHLTKYSNVTDVQSSQKKLIVDDAVVPPRALFDYSATTTMSPSFTADGALDGVAHALEVYYGATGPASARVRPIALLAIELIVRNLKRACQDGGDLAAREALGLGTDLGGYCIMIGGTNGAHLTSFSLVDVLPHGRACALMNPYYTVFFAPAIQEQLRTVGAVFAAAGYLRADLARLAGRDLGVAVAEAMIALSGDVGFPTTLSQVTGFNREEHVRRALAAAKDPQLEMKLKAMPVPLSAATVDDFLAPVLEAASTGDFSVIRNAE